MSDRQPIQKFDVYFADGRYLRFLCAVDAGELAAAERLVRQRAPAEHRDKLVVKVRGV
jgi:hypothetical protein